MATPITAATVKARFPEFASVADTTIDVFIQNSIVAMGDGDNWPRENAYQYAQGFFVAHEMSLAGYGAVSIAKLKGIEGVTRFKADDVDISFSEKSVEAKLGNTLKSTPYGRQYAELRAVYFPAIAVV